MPVTGPAGVSLVRRVTTIMLVSAEVYGIHVETQEYRAETTSKQGRYVFRSRRRVFHPELVSAGPLGVVQSAVGFLDEVGRPGMPLGVEYGAPQGNGDG